MAGDGNAVVGLREWARGMYALEAGVELLCRSFGGRFASPGQPWVRHRAGGGYWLDCEALREFSGALSGGEQRVLRVVRALACDDPLTDLGMVLAGVDRDNLALILAAFSHASGSHEHSLVRRDGGRAEMYRPGPVLAWPGEGVA